MEVELISFSERSKAVANKLDLLRFKEVQDCECAFLDEIESVTLADDILSIGNRAFASNPKLREVVWKGVTYDNVDRLIADLNKDCVIVGENVFEGTAIERFGKFYQLLPGLYDTQMEIVCGWSTIGVEVKDGILKAVGGGVLEMSKILNEKLPTVRYVALPEDIESLCYGVFANCKNIKGVILPKRLASVGEHTFKNCEALEMIVLPTCLSRMGREVFLGCEWLHSFKWRGVSYNSTWEEMKWELARGGVRIQ